MFSHHVGLGYILTSYIWSILIIGPLMLPSLCKFSNSEGSLYPEIKIYSGISYITAYGILIQYCYMWFQIVAFTFEFLKIMINLKIIRTHT